MKLLSIALILSIGLNASAQSDLYTQSFKGDSIRIEKQKYWCYASVENIFENATPFITTDNLYFTVSYSKYMLYDNLTQTRYICTSLRDSNITPHLVYLINLIRENRVYNKSY